MEDKPKIKCVIVGDGGVGKRSLVTRYCKNTFYEDYTSSESELPTVDIKVGEREVSTQLMVLAGQDDCAKMRAALYPGTHVFVLCFDIGDRASAGGIATRWRPELGYHCGDHTPTVLVGTKLDNREHDSDSQKALSTREGEDIARLIRAASYVECSAQSGQGVTEVFQEAVKAHLFRKKRPKKGQRALCLLC
ncbi:hypothetical protein RRG08_012631 [Elysia crispata]|uniref:Uncharacterized protein n=1 Tax=Elysia crispata TaxID=231223 RepID=A0AAE0YXK3_9GAST|nr:hypothetical protein RRG08_012631 [Elysia crispata]